jgi:MFS family permease
MYFAGEVTFGILVTRMADIYGRKWLCWFSYFLSLPLQLGFLLSTDLTLTTVLFFFFGACTPGKLQVTFVYLTELVPSSYRTLVGTLILFSDASSMILLPLYFRFVSKNWLWFQLASLILNVLSVTGMLLFIPESPRYLWAKGDQERCQYVIR